MSMDFSKEEFDLGKINQTLKYAFDWENLTSEFLLVEAQKYTIENDKMVPDGDKREYWIVMQNPKNHDVIAYCVLYQKLHTIEGFVVSSKYRNKGNGQRFLQFCIEQFGINTIEVYASNYTALRLYKRVGFQVVASRMEGNHKLHTMKLFNKSNTTLEAYLI